MSPMIIGTKRDIHITTASDWIAMEAVTEKFYDEMLNLNAQGHYFIVQKLVPLMPERSSVVFSTSPLHFRRVENEWTFGKPYQLTLAETSAVRLRYLKRALVLKPLRALRNVVKIEHDRYWL